MATPENAQLSSAQQFKQRREATELGEKLTLSSGLTIQVRRPSVSKLISQGMIPADLVQVFLNVQGKSTDNMKPEDLAKLLQFQRIIAENAFISPRVVSEPKYDDNEIAIDDIEEIDLEDVWAYVNGGTDAVKSFREQRSGVLSGHTSEALSEPPTE